MRNILVISCSALMLCMAAGSVAAQPYTQNRYPLVQRPFMELPLGSVKAKGWLEEMLRRQAAGMTSQMDTLYPLVMGTRNGWLGGDGDQWERGPYWIDGLLPLAHILDDPALKKKVKPWIEWTLGSQREDGFFGPARDYPYEEGIQRDNSADWWPRMVALKYLMQYYSATADPRVPTFMSRYFRYQLSTLPSKPLGNWTFWAEYRACDNILAVLWLYNLTGERFLLELADLIHKQAYNFTEAFLYKDVMWRQASIHCVNLAQGMKEPVVYYQRSGDKIHLEAVHKGFTNLMRFNGWPCGMYGADEGLHGNNPTQGSELCSAVELMFSLEEMTRITGDSRWAEHLERVAFNALPTQISDDFMTRQYYQQANQVMITRHRRNFEMEHDGTDVVFGFLTGYACCTSNLHQGWPKFTHNLWYATPDGGLAAMIYSPSEVTARVAGGVTVTITEDTAYPMEGKITFTVALPGKNPVAFPLRLRIPSWCDGMELSLNGEPLKWERDGDMALVDRSWRNGDRVELALPMKIRIGTWYENSISVERGPLVFALKMEEKWEKREIPAGERIRYGDYYYDVLPGSKWNYGLVNFDYANPDSAFEVVIDKAKLSGNYYWNTANAPVEIRAKAKELPLWTLYNESCGPQPCGRMHNDGPGNKHTPVESITLIPYGCTTLRISNFPVLTD